MKKIILTIIGILLCVIAYLTVANGYKLGNIEVLGISNIKNESETLDKKIEEAEKLNTVTYLDKMSELNTTAKELIKEKKTYEELITYSKDSDIEKATQTQNYDVQFLWTKIGTYATKNGVKLKLDIIQNSVDTDKNSNICYLKFTANGTYIAVTDFIADLEKDAKLSFTIEEFALIPGENNKNLKATFKVNNIAINSDTTTSITGR